ncbi:MAG: AAA family ATPase [Endomicrobiales bacterium]
MTTRRLVIGLTGTYCSGKDTVADYLVKRKGYAHYSLSDELRAELRRRDIPPTRENLIKVGTDLRRAEGNAVLAKRVLASMKKNTGYVITSLRHPAEIAELRTHSRFYLINVDAPEKLRFARMRARRRRGDPRTFKRFVELEKKESQSKGPGQQLRKCGEQADITIINDARSLEELYARVDTVLAGLTKARRRPGRPRSPGGTKRRV